MSKPFITPHRLASITRDYGAIGWANAVPAPRYSAKPESVFPVSALTGEYRLSQIGATVTPTTVCPRPGRRASSNLPNWREVVSLLIKGAGVFAAVWFGMALASGFGAS